MLYGEGRAVGKSPDDAVDPDRECLVIGKFAGD